jgi:hypothetical protein
MRKIAGSFVVEAQRRGHRPEPGRAEMGFARLSDLAAASIGFPAPETSSSWVALGTLIRD